MNDKKPRGADDPITLDINNATTTGVNYGVVGLTPIGNVVYASGYLPGVGGSGTPSTSFSGSGFASWQIYFQLGSNELETVRFQGDTTIMLQIAAED